MFAAFASIQKNHLSKPTPRRHDSLFMKISRILRWLLALVPLFLSNCLKTEADYRVRGKEVFYVTYQGNGLWNEATEHLVDGADGRTFKRIHPGPFSKDAKQIIYRSYVLPGSDAKTFKLLDDQGYYAKDANQVYCEGVIEGADPASFEFVGGVKEKLDTIAFYRVAKDKKDYYLGNSPMHIRDLASFKIAVDGGAARDIWAYDNINYYVGADAFPIADVATFQFLKSGFAKDSKQVYHLKEILADADPKTFEAFEDDYAKDAKRVYHGGDRITDPGIKVLELADAATFKGLKSHYAKDAKQVYFDGGVFPEADPKTFEALDYCYGKDAKNAYCWRSVVEGADLATFVIVGPDNVSGSRFASGYAKDKNKVYCGAYVVLDADAATFQAVKSKAWDKSKTYYGDQGVPST
jgi:hypothetical protein